MEPPANGPAGAEARELAAALQREGERLAKGGWLAQAYAVLEQSWALAEHADPDLANTIAWEIGWLAIRLGQHTEAGGWFERMTGPPVCDEELWRATQSVLVQLCWGHSSAPLVQPLPGPSLSVAPVAPRLRVHNLGRFQIFRGEQELPACTTRRPLALFRYLLARPHRAASKEELMEILWPDAPARKAAHSLHVAVNAVRRYLDPPEHTYLLFEAGRYCINPHMTVEDDCQLFQASMDQADQGWEAGDLVCAQQGYVAALTHYHGDYYLDDQDQAWALTEREQLLVRCLLALDRLGRTYMAEQRYEAAIDCYQRLLQNDAYREDVHAQLIRCYTQLGRRGEALRQYERCAVTLNRDLGLEPMPETQALYQAIMADDLPPLHSMVYTTPPTGGY